MAEYARKKSGDSITALGKQKVYILENGIDPFIKTFEKIHKVELKNSVGLDELREFKLDKQAIDELKEVSAVATSMISGAASGVAVGAITAFGAYGGAMAFGAASTGTAIATLSGAAATNATLAFLGGGALSVGGMGIAGGTVILGGLVAGPALAVFGIFVGAKAKANNDAAYSNWAKAKEFEEEMLTLQSLCMGIRLRSHMFTRLLLKLDCLLQPLVYEMGIIIETSGTDFSKYSDSEKQIVAKAMSVAAAIKAVLDTPILDSEGNLTDESEKLSQKLQKEIDKI